MPRVNLRNNEFVKDPLGDVKCDELEAKRGIIEELFVNSLKFNDVVDGLDPVDLFEDSDKFKDVLDKFLAYSFYCGETTSYVTTLEYITNKILKSLSEKLNG